MKAIKAELRNILDLSAPMPESVRRKKLLDFMLWVIIGMSTLVLLFHFFYILLAGPSDDPGNPILLIGVPVTIVLLVIVMLINHLKGGYWASITFVVITFAASLMDEPAQVAEGRSLLYFSIPIVLSSLIIRPWAGFVTAGLACIFNIIYVVMTPDTAINGSALIAYIILAGIMWLATSSLENSIQHLNMTNRALGESEERYRSLVEISPDIVIVSDLEDTIKMANRSFLELLGYESETAVIGMKTWDFIDPTDHEKVKDRYRRLILGEIPKASGLEVSVNKKDGSTIYMEIKSSLIRDTVTGQPVRVIGVGRDITLRKKTELQLLNDKDRLEDTVRESDLAYQNLVDHSNQGMVMFHDIRTIKANQALAEICGLTLQKVYDTTTDQFLTMLHPDDYEATMAYVQECLAGKTSRYHEARLVLENGLIRWVEFTLLQVSFMGRHAIQLTVIDRTERKQVELALAESVNHLTELESSLRDAKEDLETRVAERTSELNASREQLRQLTRQLVTIQESERRRVSRELHDEAGQILIGLKYRLGEALSCLPYECGEARQRITIAMTGIDQAMQKIRALAHDLRPPTLDVAGINLSLQSYCQEFSEQVSIPVKYKGAELSGLTDEISISLYRILQEGLTNIAKHAQETTHVNVILSYNKKSVILTIADNGSGFYPVPNKKGIGLLGMQERLALLGGHLQISPGTRRGTRLKAVIPLPTRTQQGTPG
jgi:PAS domain S-box-containing protein